MLTIDDPLHKATSAIQAGSGSLPPLYQHLADWTREHMSVKVLNIAYRSAGAGCAPRLTLVLETETERKSVSRGDSALASRRFADFVRNTLVGLAPQVGVRLDFDLKALEVVVASYAAPIIASALRRGLSHGKIALLQKLSRYNVYDLRASGSETVVVFYTELSQEISQASGEIAIIREIYARHLEEYDPAGYCAASQLLLRFENLETREDRSVVAFLPKPVAALQVPLPEPGKLPKSIGGLSFLFERANALLSAARAMAL